MFGALVVFSGDRRGKGPLHSVESCLCRYFPNIKGFSVGTRFSSAQVTVQHINFSDGGQAIVGDVGAQ